MKLKKIALTGIALLSLLSYKELNANLDENSIQIANSQKTYKNMNYLFDFEKKYEFNATYENINFGFMVEFPEDSMDLLNPESSESSLNRKVPPLRNQHTGIDFKVRRELGGTGRCFYGKDEYIGKVKNKYEIEFKVTDEFEDGAMGGRRTTGRTYVTKYKELCYEITSRVYYMEGDFNKEYTMRGPTPEEIKQKEIKLKKELELNRAVINTFFLFDNVNL